MTPDKSNKRAFEQADSNLPSQSKTQKMSNNEIEDTAKKASWHRSSQDSEDDDVSIKELKDQGPEDYIPVIRPTWDTLKEHPDRDDDEFDRCEDDDQVGGEGVLHDSQLSRWKWTMMRGAWIKVAELDDQAFNCNPDNFDMYLFNDFHSYGLHELVECLVSLRMSFLNSALNIVVASRV